jgi:hypothetical protein
MAIERRVITAQNSVSQRVLAPRVTTTDATETVVYTSQAAIAELRRINLRCTVIVSTPNAGLCSSIIAEGTLARAAGGSLRLVDTNYTRSQGEINSNSAKVAIKANAGTNRFQVTVTGKAATTYEWFLMIDLFRSN